MIRFPWACGELPQTPSSGISPTMFIPQESRHFQDLLALFGITETLLT
jgi:hypothetical protein